MRGPVTWEAKLLARPVQSRHRCKWLCDVDSEEDLIARIVEAATIRQQPGIFESSRQSLLLRCRLFIEVGGCTFEHML